MLVLRPPVFLNDERSYETSSDFFEQFASLYNIPNYSVFDSAQYNTLNLDSSRFDERPSNNYDLRLILVRHADRVDMSYGDKWYEHVFGGASSVPPQKFRHPLLPNRLPYRSNTILYAYDPPITRAGERQSAGLGSRLARLGGSLDACYSSPASRCVITANAILQGMGRSHVPIRIEPYLYEPMNWNKGLQELGNIPPFLSSGDWMNSGYNVDRSYRRISNYLNPNENENKFWERSKHFFDLLNYNTYGRRSNVLIVGHAATPLIYSTIAFNESFSSRAFGRKCGSVPFLHTVVLERNSATQTWSMRPIMA